MQKVLLAMSGGLDSSVSVKILMDRGFEVYGLTFINFDLKNPADYQFIEDAKNVAENFGIKHFIIDIRKEFKTKIIDPFVSEYLKGRTPNPCVICNRIIKWKTFIDFANELNIKYIATGHYANLKQDNNRFFISKGIDNLKDQSYFLWNLTQEQLERTLFPLGGLKKEEIKKIANELGLDFLTKKKESYDVCFVRTDDYREFIREYISKNDIHVNQGDILDENNNIVGKHKGIPYYTIGQRKGLGIAMGHPVFVKEIDAKKNTIKVVPKEKLSQNIVYIKDFNLQKYEYVPEKKLFDVKLRYRDKGNKAYVKYEGKYLKLEFPEPVYAVTPGQSAVIYDNDDIVAGGVIFNPK